MLPLSSEKFLRIRRMEKAKTFLAFGFGCVTAMMLGFGPITSTMTASEPEVFESRLNALEERAAELEQTAASSQVGSKVVAPFDVVDPAKGKIFSVQPDGNVRLFYARKGEAEIGADSQGGHFHAYTPSESMEVTLGAQQRGYTWGVSVGDNYVDRIELGTANKGGLLHVTFWSPAREEIAGIGESVDKNSAAALVFDKSGNLRARMTIDNSSGAGLIDVLGANKIPIAQITESEHGGGKLWIGNSGGQGMVEAGDAGGYGLVSVGPRDFKFIPTPGLALPGTSIVGKQ